MNKKLVYIVVASALLLAVAAIILLPRLQSSEAYQLTVSLDNGANVLKKVSIQPRGGQSLLQSMAENVDGVEDDNGFIVSIMGHVQDAERGAYWLYAINGEFATVGAGDYYPRKGDEIVFDLHAFE